MGGHGWHIGTPLHRKECLSLLPCFFCSAGSRSLWLLLNCYEYVRYVMRFFWAVAERSNGSLNIIAHTHLAINIRITKRKPLFGCPLLCWLLLSSALLAPASGAECVAITRCGVGTLRFSLLCWLPLSLGWAVGAVAGLYSGFSYSAGSRFGCQVRGHYTLRGWHPPLLSSPLASASDAVDFCSVGCSGAKRSCSPLKQKLTSSLLLSLLLLYSSLLAPALSGVGGRGCGWPVLWLLPLSQVLRPEKGKAPF